MKVFNYSGGATKISGLFAKGEQIIKDFGYTPDIITGVSSGALLALPTALGLWDEMKTLVLNFDNSMVFSVPPFNEKGKLTLKNIYRVVIGEPSLGKQDALYSTLSKLITKKRFLDYKSNPRYPKVYVGVTNYNLGKFCLIDVKNLCYEEYLKYTIASTSIPYAVEPVKINEYYYYDGGVIHHTCFRELVKLYPVISHNITAYSRPEIYDCSYPNFNGVDLSQVIKATTDLQVNTISIKDQDFEFEFCKSYDIKLKQLFCPKIMESLYDMNKDRIALLYYKSRKEQIKDFVQFLL